MMKKLSVVNYLVVHCSATKASMDIGVEEIDAMHKARNFIMCGYHYVIRRDGALEEGRPHEVRGAHAKGHNWESLGLCMVGGIDEAGKAENNFSDEQLTTLRNLIRYLRSQHPNAKVLGHRDLSPDLNNDGKITPNEYMKECPCFDVKPWYEAKL